MITREGGTEDELRAVSSRQCLLLVGTRQKKKKKVQREAHFHPCSSSRDAMEIN